MFLDSNFVLALVFGNTSKAWNN